MKLPKAFSLPLKITLAVLGTLLLIEAILWIGFRQGREPSVKAEYHQDFPGLKKNITYERNALGLRTLSMNTWAKPDNTIRILCIGASTTDQGTQNTEDMWMAHLERKLNTDFADSGLTFQLATYARGGNKIHEVARWCHLNLDRLDPDGIITLFGMNALVTDMQISKQTNTDNLRKYVIEKKPNPLIAFLASTSQIYRHSKQISENSRQKKYLEEKGGLNFDIQGVAQFRAMYWQTPLNDAPATRPGATRHFKELMTWFVGWIRSQNLELVIMAQPLLLHADMNYTDEGNGRISFSNIHPNKVEEVKAELAAIWFVMNTGSGFARLRPGPFRDLMSQYNRVQAAIAETHNAGFVPLDEKLEPNLENFFDDCHFTDIGSQRLADIAYPEVKAMAERIISKRNTSK